MLTILFPSHPMYKKQIDSDFQEEYDTCNELAIQTILFDLDAFINGGNLVAIPVMDQKSEIIYRGWMLTENQYQRLYDQLLIHNYQLINSPTQYLNAHHLPRWYELLQTVTPRSVFSIGKPSNEELIQLLQSFRDQSIMIKDYVKSRKYEWKEAFYIPNASKLEEAELVSRNFIERQGKELVGGIVFRSFEQLQSVPTIKKDRKNVMQFEEVRVFIYQKQPIAYIDYWNNAVQFNHIELDNLIQSCDCIDSNFFTIDCGKKVDGSWIIIEIGDAQVSDLQNYNALNFYQRLVST